MKTRNGFVSNSSSSSFIVAFPRLPSSVEDMKRILFGNDEVYSSPWTWDDPPRYSAMEVAERVYNDLLQYLKEHTVNDEKEITETLSHGWYVVGDAGSRFGFETLKYPTAPEGETPEQMHERWNKYSDELLRRSKIITERFLKTNKHRMTFVFHYSDQDGRFDSALEHGGLFDRLDHLVSSEH
jgi:hypothetical protein